MPNNEKTYTVVSDFNDASGTAWKAGQTYTAADAQQRVAEGVVREDTAAKK